jgi:hypothetical protein
LVVKYIQKRRYPTNAVKGLKITKEKGIIKLSWNRSEDKDVKGYYVIKNRFHPPKHFQDGVKIYGGKDNFTYDKFGATDIPKYYAVFTYDNVPNFSEPTIIRYEPLERY